MHWSGLGTATRTEEVVSYRILQADIEDYAERLRRHPLMLRIAAGRFSHADLARFLRGVLFMIEHVQVHPRLAGALARARGEYQLADYFEHKYLEENGHDQWVRQDLDTLAREGSQADGDAPRRSTTELMEFVRSSIEAEPKSYLAYILFLEYLTVLVGPDFLRGLEERCGIPRSSVSVVARHVDLDEHHVAEGLAEIEKLTAASDLPILRAVLAGSMDRYERFWDEVESRAA